VYDIYIYIYIFIINIFLDHPRKGTMILSIIIAHPTVDVGHMYGIHDR
jgi:hypothetical protein